MSERDTVEQFRNIPRFIRPGRLALVSAGIEVAGGVAALLTGDDAWIGVATYATACNAGIAAYDTAINPHSKYLGGIFRKSEEQNLEQ